jgi:hypothetical protein
MVVIGLFDCIKNYIRLQNLNIIITEKYTHYEHTNVSYNSSGQL